MKLEAKKVCTSEIGACATYETSGWTVNKALRGVEDFPSLDLFQISVKEELENSL